MVTQEIQSLCANTHSKFDAKKERAREEERERELLGRWKCLDKTRSLSIAPVHFIRVCLKYVLQRLPDGA